MEKNHILKKVKKDKICFVELHYSDLHGFLKSKRIPVKYLEDAIEGGRWFDGSSVEGFTRINESDMILKPDISTYAVLPWIPENEGKTCRFICDILTSQGDSFQGDPREILKNTIRSVKSEGYEYNVCPELEFFLFSKKDGIYTPIDGAGYFDLIGDEGVGIRREIINVMGEFGIEAEADHHEVAPGQHEISFKYDSALKTADNAMTFKMIVKYLAHKKGLQATFMPKPLERENGSGMHVNQSLFSGEENVFFDSSSKDKLSDTARHFIAGQLEHIDAITAVTNPTVNSYKRLVPGFEAPVYVCWGSSNRSALIRVPRYVYGKEKNTRLELRSPDPSSNPYLAFAVMLAAGMDGVRRGAEPPSAYSSDAYELDLKGLNENGIRMLPGSLEESIRALEKNDVLKNALGEHTFGKYIEAKRKELEPFKLQVTPLEKEMYMKY